MRATSIAIRIRPGMENRIDSRDKHQRDQSRTGEASDNRTRQRSLGVGPLSDPECQW